jgi:hypothetical protein
VHIQTLLDSSKATELVEVAEIELSKSEDNVASLAVGGRRKGDATLVYAGVNSSPSDVEQGNNLHFRVFTIERGAKEKGNSSPTSASTKIAAVSKSTLFAGTEADLYQRVLRLSRPYPDQPQLGAVATGLAKTSELAVFDTSLATLPKPRWALKSNKEIEDVDFIQTGDSEYLVGYCDEHDVHIKRISLKNKKEEPECVYITPASRNVEKPTVPKFRALRWLTKEYLLMLTNIHGGGGAVLQILGRSQSGKGQCRVVQSRRLPSNISKASGLAISNLTPPVSPSAPQGYTQFVIAVVGQDISISLFKVDLQAEDNVATISKIKPFRTLKSIHPFPITNITFSNFTPPAHPVTASTPPQYLKLASVSVGNTAVVHTLPLFPVPLSVKRGQSKTPRYVVALPSGAATFGLSVLVSIVVVSLVAVLLQGILEVRGAIRPFLNATQYIPVNWQPLVIKPYIVPGEDAEPAVVVSEVPHTFSEDGQPPLHQLVERLKSRGGRGVIVVRDTPDSEDGITADLHDEQEDGPHGGRGWEALSREEKEAWKKKLKDSGHWVENFGETILKSVLFGELAGVVGQVVQG